MKLNTLALALLLTPIAGSALAEVTFTPFATYRHFDNQTVEKLSLHPPPDLFLTEMLPFLFSNPRF